MQQSSARLLREARVLRGFPPFAFLAAAFFVLLQPLAPPEASAAREDLGPMPWRVGGKVGFTVDAAAFPDSANGIRMELYLRVPPSTLSGLARDQQGAAHLSLRTQFKTGHGAKQSETTQDFTLQPGTDSLAGFGKVILIPFAARPGTQRLKLRLQDNERRKVGLIYTGTAEREHSDIDGEFNLPGAVEGRMLSDLLFIWNEADVDSANAFHRDGRVVLPNPERLYGLFQRQLRVSFYAVSRDGSRPWQWRARVLDGKGTVHAEQTGTGPAATSLEGRVSFSVTRVVAGGYDLEVQAWQEGDAKPLQRKSRFSVAWTPEAWLRSATEVQDLVHFLLRADDEERFATMHPGEQERLLDDFWRRRDPSPDTPENENRELFLARVDEANERYGRAGMGRGMFSDMGRTFIRYGEPNEILRQVMPTGDHTLTQVLRELAVEEDRALGSIHQKGPGGDMRPFEVWVYEGEIPVPPDADLKVQRNVRHRRMVFLFVDERGLGDYRLRYSNE